MPIDPEFRPVILRVSFEICVLEGRLAPKETIEAGWTKQAITFPGVLPQLLFEYLNRRWQTSFGDTFTATYVREGTEADLEPIEWPKDDKPAPAPAPTPDPPKKGHRSWLDKLRGKA